MRFGLLKLAAVSFFALESVVGHAVADTPPPATPTAYTPGAAAVVSALNGLVAGTKTSVDNYRTTSRTIAFRGALMHALMNLDKDSFAKPVRITAANVDILCGSRAVYATNYAQMTYVGTITGALNKAATPAKISSIGDAFASFFQNYSIDAGAKLSSDAGIDVTRNCEKDIDAWVQDYYGADLVKLPPVPKPGLVLDPVTALSTFNDLFQTLVTIITPLITTPATAIDAKKRSDAINDFLKKNYKDLQTGADNIAKFGAAQIASTRLQAVGQFADSMASARTFSIDLSKVDACRNAYSDLPGSLVVERKDATGKVTSRLPSDDFAVCYAQAWAQLKPAATVAAAAAAGYDSLADTSSDQVTKAAQVIHDNMDKIDQPAKMNISQLVSAATQLITYGQAVSQALSAANIAKVKTDVETLMKQF